MRSMWSNSCCSIASYEGRKGLCFAMTLWPHLRLEELAWAWHRSAWWMHLLGVCQSKWVSSLTSYALLLVSVCSLGVNLDIFWVISSQCDHWSSLLRSCTEDYEEACLVVWTSLSLAQCAVTVALCDTLSCDHGWITYFKYVVGPTCTYYPLQT